MHTEHTIPIVNQRFEKAGLPWRLRSPGKSLIAVIPPFAWLAPDILYPSNRALDDRIKYVVQALGYPIVNMKSKHSAWALTLPVPEHLSAPALIERAMRGDHDRAEALMGTAAALQTPLLRPVYLDQIRTGLSGKARSAYLRRAINALVPVATEADIPILLRCCAYKSTAVMLSATRGLYRLGVLGQCAKDNLQTASDHEESMALALDIALHHQAEALDSLLREGKPQHQMEALWLTLDVLNQLALQSRKPSARPTLKNRRASPPLPVRPAPLVNLDAVRSFTECLTEHFKSCEDGDLQLLMSWCLGLCVHMLGDEAVEPILQILQQSNLSEEGPCILMNALSRYNGSQSTRLALAAELERLQTPNDNDAMLAQQRVQSTLRRREYATPLEAWITDGYGKIQDLYDPTRPLPERIQAILKPQQEKDALACLETFPMKHHWSSNELSGVMAATALNINPNLSICFEHLVLNPQATQAQRVACAGALLASPQVLAIDPLLLRTSLGGSIGARLEADDEMVAKLLALSTSNTWRESASRLLERANTPHQNIWVSAFLRMHQQYVDRNPSEQTQLLCQHFSKTLEADLPIERAPNALMLSLMGIPVPIEDLEAAVQALPKPEQEQALIQLLLLISPISRKVGRLDRDFMLAIARETRLWALLTPEALCTIWLERVQSQAWQVLEAFAEIVANMGPDMIHKPHEQAIVSAIVQMSSNSDADVREAAKRAAKALNLKFETVTATTLRRDLLLHAQDSEQNPNIIVTLKRWLKSIVEGDERLSEMRLWASDQSFWGSLTTQMIPRICIEIGRSDWVQREFTARILEHIPLKSVNQGVSNLIIDMLRCFQIDPDPDVRAAAIKTSNILGLPKLSDEETVEPKRVELGCDLADFQALSDEEMAALSEDDFDGDEDDIF